VYFMPPYILDEDLTRQLVDGAAAALERS